jgi:opacity protein-like surface antigen
MRATRFVLAGALVTGLGLISQTALAADVAPRPPAVVIAATPWHGLYFGGGGGYAWGDIHTRTTTEIPAHGLNDPLPTEHYNPRIIADGGFWTAIVGADIQRGNHVFGIFADYDWLHDFRGSESLPVPSVDPNFAKTVTADIDNMLTVAGRLGWTWRPESLIYALAGWSWARGSLNVAEECDPGFCDDLIYGGDIKYSGWTVGAGLERLFHDNRWSLRLEYRYTRLEGGSVSGSCTSPGDCGRDYFGTASADADVQSVRAVATFRLGHLRRL